MVLGGPGCKLVWREPVEARVWPAAVVIVPPLGQQFFGVTERAEQRLVQQLVPEPPVERLHERGVVEARGEKRGRIYHLSSTIYKAMGLKTGYVRSRGFDRIKQEAMVLELVRSNGRVTRSEVAELCNLGDLQAYRLVTGLAKAGKLALRGKKRGSYYESV